MKNNIFQFLKNTSVVFSLIILSALLFSFANPGFIFSDGISFFGWIYYIPVLFIVKKCSFKSVFFAGGAYGALSYGLYVHWLKNFNPIGLTAACIAYFFILGFVFLLLKFSELRFGKSAWIIQSLVLASYEYLKTLGFAGFGYGVTAYTQWQMLWLIQICSFAGVFGLNFIMIFTQCAFFSFIKFHDKKSAGKFLLCLFFVLLNVIFGAYKVNQYDKEKYENTVTVCAVQNNENPWKNGIEEYSKNIEILKQLTDKAFSENNEIQLVVWPETAVVPSIMFHYEHRTDERRYIVVKKLLEYINKKNFSFVIGNNHEVMLSGLSDRACYNSVLFFEPGRNVIPPEPEIYSKQHLVPFTECFPLKNIFPRVYQKLLNGDTHMWEAGTEPYVFECEGLKFSTPVCFEDNFGDICRNMALNGADCFINLSNDSWSGSLACQKQHLAMAVFRSVENALPSVRSTSSGQTCIINRNGKIEVQAKPFCRTYITGKINVNPYKKKTFFTKTGNIFGTVPVIVLFVLLIMNIITGIIKKYR